MSSSSDEAIWKACLCFTERKTTVGDALPQALRRAGVTALTAAEGEVLFPTRRDLTSLTCAEVHYHLVTQKEQIVSFSKSNHV